MKKFIVLIMALITIFSASVSAYANSGTTVFVDWDIVNTILNLQQNSQNCTIVKYNTARPSPSMVDGTGAIKTQKTTYNALLGLYETVTIEGASWADNVLTYGQFQWFEYGGYCWIRYIPDGGVTNICWVANYQGKILYCDAPVEEDNYTISAIAGATGYCLTDRPAGTMGNGYLGDLLVTQDNLTTIHGVVDGLGGVADYYMVLRIVNGEYRYYIMCTYPNRQQYFVCNTSGQLFYALRDEVTDDGGDTGGGSTFDPTEVITAINSVYSAINSMNSNLGSRLANILNATNGIGVSVENLAANVVTGFTGVQEQLSTLNSYFTDLSGLFPVQEEITLLGSDTRVAWDSADRITGVKTSGFNGDLIVKERPGDLVDESGYEKVTINETEYSLYNDTNGYRRIKVANEYPDTGPNIPDDTLFYFPFEDTLSSSVGSAVLTTTGSPQYTDGLTGKSYLFNGTNHLTSTDSGVPSSLTTPFTYSFWFFAPSFPSGSTLFEFDMGSKTQTTMYISFSNGYVHYQVKTSDYTYGTDSTVTANKWCHYSITFDGNNLYFFIDGTLLKVVSINVGASVVLDPALIVGRGVTSGCMLDDFMFVEGTALWTSSFNPNLSAKFEEVVKDYFLPCTDQDITLNFYDSTGAQVTEHRWNQYTINTSRLPDGYTELEYIESTGTQRINSGVSVSYSDTARLVLDAQFKEQNIVYGGADIYLQYSISSVCAIENGRTGVPVGNRDIIDITWGNGVQTLRINDVVIDSKSWSTSNTYKVGLFCLLTNNDSWYSSNTQQGKIYSCQIYVSGLLVRDFVPCKNPSNAVGLYDLVSGQFYGNSGTGSFTAGAEVSNGSSIGQLVGVVSSINANAYPDGGEQDGFYYEYIGSFTEYPSFSQTLSPTDVNGNAITMGRLEDDFSEIYMDITSMQWYCHDPQTQTEILLSASNQQIMNDTIYVRQNYSMLPADQITADALQNLLPVDAPVYLDMPEGAKITITYDHYSGWFRAMYILMDKQNQLLNDLDIVNETIINVENTVVDITQDNDAYNIFYITKTDGTTESVGDAAKDAAVFVGDILSMFYRLVFDDALDNVGILKDFEGAYSNTEVSVW